MNEGVNPSAEQSTSLVRYTCPHNKVVICSYPCERR